MSTFGAAEVLRFSNNQLQIYDRISPEDMIFSKEELQQLMRALAECATYVSVPPSRSPTALALLLSSLRVRCLRALKNLLRQPCAATVFMALEDGEFCYFLFFFYIVLCNKDLSRGISQIFPRIQTV